MDLMYGQWIAEHGIPHTVSLTVMGAGRPWIDQQWLGQVVLHGIWSLGGVWLLRVMLALVMAGAVTIILTPAWLDGRRGALVAGTLLGGVPLVAFSPIRAQVLAYPLFAAVYVLLLLDCRRRSWRVWLVLPLLVVWANVHGSVLLGVALVGLRALVAVSEGYRHPTVGTLGRVVAFPALAAASVVVTPYGTGVLAYYRETADNPAFRKLVSEWQPIWVHGGVFPMVAAVLVVAGAIVLWSPRPRPEWLWVVGVGVLLTVMALAEQRNLVWLALATVPVVSGCDPSSRAVRALTRQRQSLMTAGTLVTGSLLAGMALSLLPAYPAAAPGVIARVAGATGRVLADPAYADWLMMQQPSLQGRLGYDSALEQLTGSQLDGLARFQGHVAPGWQAIANGYRVVVVDSTQTPGLARALTGTGRWRQVYARDGLVALTRS